MSILKTNPVLETRFHRSFLTFLLIPAIAARAAPAAPAVRLSIPPPERQASSTTFQPIWSAMAKIGSFKSP